MKRAVVTVATDSFLRGGDRLNSALKAAGEHHIYWRDAFPSGSPPHRTVPYAFKCAALRHASEQAEILLWADSSVLPVRPLRPLWERIERYGYWISDNGFVNSDWTADSAYPALFPGIDIEIARRVNRQIKHVVATSFGL